MWLTKRPQSQNWILINKFVCVSVSTTTLPNVAGITPPHPPKSLLAKGYENKTFQKVIIAFISRGTMKVNSQQNLILESSR